MRVCPGVSRSCKGAARTVCTSSLHVSYIENLDVQLAVSVHLLAYLALCGSPGVVVRLRSALDIGCMHKLAFRVVLRQ